MMVNKKSLGKSTTVQLPSEIKNGIFSRLRV